MKELIIESFFWTPHIETAYEIALEKKRQGSDVSFCLLNIDNPEEFPANLNIFGLCKYYYREQTKLKRIRKGLKLNDIDLISKPFLSENVKSRIADFVSNAPDTIEALQSYKYGVHDLGLAVASSLISYTKNPYPDFQIHHKKYKLLLKNAALVYEFAAKIYRDFKPERVISFNGRFAGSKGLFVAAEELNIDIQYHERGATYDKYELFSRPPHDVAYIRQEIGRYWNENNPAREEIGHSFFKRRRAGEGIGWISFTDKQYKGKSLLKTDKKKLVYFSSSDDEFAAVGDIVQHPVFSNQREAINYLRSWVSAYDDTELVIRLHPHLAHKSSEELVWWESLHAANVTIIPAASDVDSYSLLEWSDIVITYGSTVGAEATYWGKPSLLIGDGAYSALDCVYTVNSVEHLNTLLNADVLPPMPQENCLPFGYYYLSFGRTYNHYVPINLFEGKLAAPRRVIDGR